MKVVWLCYPFLVSSTEIKGPKEFTLSVSLCILGELTKFGANPSPILRSCWIDLTSAFGLMVTSSADVTPRAYTLGGTGTRRPFLAPSEHLA
ncbi:hypothetical protein KY290_009422 [Solanum tuberosum]|uniref:Secreted protein n=1 Tax=Solanum tuberosum TaxID=4113 RepID=A0ABQ7WB80_SOLTU|nr:hypothetical protein KY290_009422 [Solanum tuberosum]